MICRQILILVILISFPALAILTHSTCTGQLHSTDRTNVVWDNSKLLLKKSAFNGIIC